MPSDQKKNLMPNAYRMQRPFLYLVGITIQQCWHLVVACSVISYLHITPEEFHTEVFKEHTIVMLVFFSFQTTIFCVITRLLCALLIFKSWLWSSRVDCLTSPIYLNEVAKPCPVPKAVCPRGKSFCFSLSALSARGSSHAGVMQKDLLMQKWCTSCFSSGDGSAWQTDPEADHTHNVYFSDMMFSLLVSQSVMK